MRHILYATFSFILCINFGYGTEKESVFIESAKALHQEIEQKTIVLKGLEENKSSQIPHFVTAQYKEYLEELKKLESSSKVNQSINLEESKSDLTETYNIFTEVYYQ